MTWNNSFHMKVERIEVKNIDFNYYTEYEYSL